MDHGTISNNCPTTCEGMEKKKGSGRRKIFDLLKIDINGFTYQWVSSELNACH